MVPPWADGPAAGAGADGGDDGSPGDPREPGGGPEDEDGMPAPEPPAPKTPIPLAPAARFKGARASLSEFSRSGKSEDLKRGLGHYVRTGYGGAATASRRFARTGGTAGALYNTLSALAAGQPVANGQLQLALLKGRTTHEVIDAVVDALRPSDGTLDAEATRYAIADALAELLTQFPNADLLNPTEDQKVCAVEAYAASEVFRRIDLDIGMAIREKAQSVAIALARLNDVRDYVFETVAAAFRRLKSGGQALTGGQVEAVTRAALREALSVFEGYAT